MSFVSRSEVERRVEAARFEQAKKNCVAAVFAKFPTIVQCDASARAVLDIIAQFVGRDSSVLPSLDLFLSALDENPSAMQDIATRPVEVSKLQVVEDYLNLLNAHSRQNFQSLKLEKSKMVNLTLQECRERLNSLRLRQDMAAKYSTGELHKVLQDSQTPTAYPALPKVMFNSATGKYDQINAAFLRQTDYLKKYVRIYGIEQVNRRLAGQ